MSLRTLCLFPLLNAAKLNVTTSSSFLTLQIAASREWSRRTMTHSHTKIPARDAPSGKKLIESGSSDLTPGQSRMAGATSISCKAPRDAKIDDNSTARLASNEKTTVLRDRRKKEQRYVHNRGRTNCEEVDLIGRVPGYTDFDPELNNYKPTHTDLSFEEPPIEDYFKTLSSKDLSSYLTTANIESFRRTSLPTPTSERGLYHNLIHILRTRTTRPSLAALVDYHRLFPNHHSTKSYNLLIFLSLHHRAYGITRALFRGMQDRSIKHNTETHRLHIRLLIYRGFWDKAWSYAMGLMNNFPGGGTLFPIWSEFCHTRKGPMIIENAYNPGGKRLQEASEPVSLISARRDIMNTNRPLSIPELKDTPPAGMHVLLQLMIKSRLKHQALKLTEDYFRALPVKMDSKMNYRCLAIIKIHLAANGIGKTGQPRFNVAKKLLFSLLSLNPSLRPTSETLLFMLGILKKAKRCGKVAYDFITFCKEKWGPEVEDRRIRRRVSRLALKEGRMDIVETMMRAEGIDNCSRRLRLLEHKAVGDSIPRPRVKLLHRPSIRRIYPHNGREHYMWRCLRIRVRRTVGKRIAKGRMVTKAQARKYTKSLRLLGKQVALNRTMPMRSMP